MQNNKKYSVKVKSVGKNWEACGRILLHPLLSQLNYSNVQCSVFSPVMEFTTLNYGDCEIIHKNCLAQVNTKFMLATIRFTGYLLSTHIPIQLTPSQQLECFQLSLHNPICLLWNISNINRNTENSSINKHCTQDPGATIIITVNLVFSLPFTQTLSLH